MLRPRLAALIGTFLLCGAAPAQPDTTLQPYAKPQQLAALPDGRRIHVFCMGQGSPTVILSAGAGNWLETWRTVQSKIAQKTRVCAWDRAGYGFSSPSTEPQDVVHTSRDMAEALKSAGIRGPYILVGHSLGGYESLLFADGHPHDVVGMVLEDPSFPDQPAVWRQSAPEYWAYSDALTQQGIDALKRCGSGLRTGAVKIGSPDPDSCLTLPAEYPADLQANFLKIRVDPARSMTKASFLEHTATDGAQLVNPSRNYGSMPLIVLTAGSPALPQGAPKATVADAEKFFVEWSRAHDSMAKLSSDGSNRTVDGSSHYIHLIKPQVVIDAVNEVILKARRPN